MLKQKLKKLINARIVHQLKNFGLNFLNEQELQ